MQDSKRPLNLRRVMTYGNALIAAGIALYFLIVPGLLVIRNLRDPALRTGEIPREAWRLHRYLSPRYERWARQRIASKKAAAVAYRDVPDTEWPLFGSVFYLWGTEHLQEAWQRNPQLAPTAPATAARGAIEACKDLLLDPAHHSWVRTHWGDDYLHEQNVFFRSLLIAGLTSYERLTASGTYLPLLRDQIDTLAAELDASPHGVLYDYPAECYPIDVFAAVAWIRRADAVVGTDHSAFIERERRAIEGDRLDKNGLIPWCVDPGTGKQFEPSRGIVNSHVLTFAPEIYPELARRWYALYEQHFWQERWYGAGFREFPRDGAGGEWTSDVDAGPILGGFSPSANAFGVAAARINGRLDHGYTLAAQVLTACWPLPDGRLLGPRLLSDSVHAPYLGECGILWQLTETPSPGATIVRGGHIAGFVFIGLAFYFGGGILMLCAAWSRMRRWWHKRSDREPLWIHAQFVLWAVLVALGLTLLALDLFPIAIAALLVAQFLPDLFSRQVHTPPTSSPSSFRICSAAKSTPLRDPGAAEPQTKQTQDPP